MRYFRTLNGYQNYIRKANEALDYVKVGKIEFAMAEYDMVGRTIIYHDSDITIYYLTLEITTENRYGITKFKDAVLEIY